MKDLQLLSDFTTWVLSESEDQIAQHGVQDRSLCEWLTYTTEELGKLASAITEKQHREGTWGEIFVEAVSTATLCLKIAEMVYHAEHGKLPL